MTLKQKNNLIAEIIALLEKAIVVNEENPKPQVFDVPKPPLEMLTVKECSQILSEHTVRQWVAQGVIPYIRTGKGKRGKILISKAALLKYLDSAAVSLSMILDRIVEKFERRKPIKRTHRTVVGSI